MKKLENIIHEFVHNRDFSTITSLLVSDKKLCDDLFLMVKNKMGYPYSEYASWIITHLAKSHPQLVQKYHKMLIDILFETSNQSVLRNIAAALHQLKPIDYRESEFIDLLFDFILNKNNKVALHVYSIYLLIPFIKKYPELKNEMDEVLNINNESNSPAYKVALKNYHSTFTKK